MVKYEWDESNGVSVPTNKLMVIDADEYYVGMPLKKVDAETVAPTDGTPEYICLAQRNAGDEIRPLQIPVQEVFPDAVYTKILEDGTEEKVKFGGGGKIKPEQLPEGYPYEEIEEITVEHIAENYDTYTLIEGFPIFVIGDTVNVKVDGKEYAIVSREYYGDAEVGDSWDDYEAGTGQYGWCLYSNVYDEMVCFYSKVNRTISWNKSTTIPIDPEFIPEGYPREKKIKGSAVCNVTEDNGGEFGLIGYGFPVFSVGDTIKLEVDGVEHSLIAFGTPEEPIVGDSWDDYEAGTGQYGWCLFSSYGHEVYFYSKVNHTISWELSEITTMAKEFLGMLPVAISWYGGDYTCNKTYEEIKNALFNNIPVFAIISVRTSEKYPRQYSYGKVTFEDDESAIHFSEGYSELMLKSDNIIYAAGPM